MARAISFPRTRHVALSQAEQLDEATAKAEGAEALVVPFASAAAEAQQTPAVGNSLPSPAEVRLLPRVVAIDVSIPTSEADLCRALDGSPAEVHCASSLEGRAASGEAAARAAQLGEAVLLGGLDRWYRLGPEGAGYCRSCELALIEFLRESYGDQLQPFDPIEPLRASALPLRERPFARQKEALRLSETIESAKRAVLRARDEARRSRGLEMAVLGRVGVLSAAALELCRHLDGLLFELPSLDPMDALLPLLAARAALGQRPAVAVLPSGASAEEVQLFAALTAACDADLLLPADAPEEARGALALHRSFLALVRERFRPVEPLADAELLFSPRCDHWTSGAHQRATAACLAALLRAQLQPALRLDLSGGVRAPLLIIAGGAALSEEDAAAARRHVEGGGDLLLLGRCSTMDDEGRSGDAVFPEAKAALDQLGEGRLQLLDEAAPEAAVVRALQDLSRRRAQVTLAGRGRLFARAYLDPERKLDVHLVNLEGAAAQGVQLTIAGHAAGGGRSGYWFAPERDGGRDGERITLNPSGFSVSTILPSIAGYALLAVPR
jgi:hypothetical protein